jgi:hypothetical protein
MAACPTDPADPPTAAPCSERPNLPRSVRSGAAVAPVCEHGRMALGHRRTARAVALWLSGLVLLASCSSVSCLDAGSGAAGPTVVLQRGHLGRHPWQLVAWEQGGHLGLGLDGDSSRQQYSGGVGFCRSPSAGFWLLAAGPQGSDFYYGPAPGSATSAVLTARGRAPVVVRTRPMPHEDGLPSGRFFITGPPGPPSLVWNVTLKNASGHTVPFADF